MVYTSMRDCVGQLGTSIFEMSLAPLNFENHFFVFDVGLQKSLFLNTNVINVEFSAIV